MCFARCDQGTRGPYAPWTDAVAPLAAAPAGVTAVRDAAAAALAALAPEAGHDRADPEVARASLARAVVDYGYETSAAHYLAVADALGLDVQAFCLIFVTKTEPYRVTVADLDATFLERGRALRAKAIERALNPTADAYEGATGFLTIGCPRWAALYETEMSA